MIVGLETLTTPMVMGKKWYGLGLTMGQVQILKTKFLSWVNCFPRIYIIYIILKKFRVNYENDT